MPTETLIAVKIPSEVVARIDRVSKDRQAFVMDAIRQALVREAALHSTTDSATTDDDLSLDAESRAWLEASNEDWLRMVPCEDVEGLWDPSAGTPVKWVPGIGLVEVKEGN